MRSQSLKLALFLAAAGSTSSLAFILRPSRPSHATLLRASKGFGSSSSGSSPSKNKKGKNNKKQKNKSKTKGLMSALQEEANTKAPSKNKPLVRSEQDAMLEELARASASTVIGQAVASSPTTSIDPFWELMPSLIKSRFPDTNDSQLERIAGMAKHAVNPDLPLEEQIVTNKYRPHEDIHAYMPGLGPTKPFHDPSQLNLCRRLQDNYETIKKEYHALLEDVQNGGKDRFQSVTSMNYDAGWKTLVLFYNGHRIKGFPYHLCPVTTEIMESVPLAGRIAGFNRQQPRSGIPLHSDGNNMWLTTQMGIEVPDGDAAYIRVGPETRRWKEGECLLYDTTYEHETFNEHEDQERIVVHVDFWNTLSLTPIEIQVMQYIYSLREEFMKAEGVSKVGAQIL